MLKFIQTDSDNENLISSIMDIKDIADFMNKSTATEINSLLIQSNSNSKKNEISQSNFINKLLPMMFYEYFNKTNFAFGDQCISVIRKILEVSLQANDLSKPHLEIYVKIYLVLSSNQRGRYFAIVEMLKSFDNECKNSEILNKSEFSFDLIENILSDFIINEKEYERKEMVLFYEELSNFVLRNNLLGNLKK